MMELRFEDVSSPKARSMFPVLPKLYVSPAVPDPVPAVYVRFAFVPLSLNAQPAGTDELVPEDARVLKSCAYLLPKAVMLNSADQAQARSKNSVVKLKNSFNVANSLYCSTKPLGSSKRFF